MLRMPAYAFFEPSTKYIIIDSMSIYETWHQSICRSHKLRVSDTEVGRVYVNTIALIWVEILGNPQRFELVALGCSRDGVLMACDPEGVITNSPIFHGRNDRYTYWAARALDERCVRPML
jgi:hypothetical protein